MAPHKSIQRTLWRSLGAHAKVNNVAPQVYLRYVLGRIVEHRINLIEESLRWNVLADIPLLRLAA